MKGSVTLLTFCLLGLSVSGQSVKTTMEKGVDMTSYETFTVFKGELMTPPDARIVSEKELFESVKAAVTKEMELRGYKFVPDSSAQLYISYVAGAYNLTEGGNTGPLGQTPASTPAEMDQSRSWSRESREGMIAIDIMDSRSKKELWKATGSLALEGVDLKRASDAVIYKAFKKFPNKNKKNKK
jgi:hypothetical protein